MDNETWLATKRRLVGHAIARHRGAAVNVDGTFAVSPDIVERLFDDRLTLSASGCWVWDGYQRNAIGHRAISCGGKMVYAHRLSFALFVGPVLYGLGVLHRCDNPPCIKPEHLFTGTQADNISDMTAKGRARKRSPGGEANGNAHISDAQVDDLRSALLEPGATQRSVAKRFGVSQSTVWRIHHFKTRAEVEAR